MTSKKPSSRKRSTKRKQSSQSSDFVGAISWTKISVIEASEKSYVKSYIYGLRLSSKGLTFGSTVTDALEENNEEDLDEILQALKSLVPIYPKKDHVMESFVMVGKKRVKVWGKLDGWNGGKNLIGEYKTSLKKWSKQKSIDHGQMKIYSWMRWKNSGKIPRVELTWIGTTKEDDVYAVTGEFVTHKFQYTLKDMLETEVRIIRAYKKIEALLEKELKL